MSPDGRGPNTQQTTEDAEQLGEAPTQALAEGAAKKSPVRTSVPLSTATRPAINPHQGQPAESTSTESSYSAMHWSSPGSSPSPGPGQHPKPQNVFSNDGSFLERLQRLKREEGEKRKEMELLERKKQFADRFKNRGKRAHSELSVSSGSGNASGSGSASDGGLLTTPESLSKKVKRDGGASSSSSSVEPQPLSQYQREMQKVNTESLTGDGIGVRPLTK